MTENSLVRRQMWWKSDEIAKSLSQVVFPERNSRTGADSFASGSWY
jgi:hypothetical protein